MDEYIGTVALFSFGFAPEGWLDCDGRQLEISNHEALFSLIGTSYGGDGTRTFALPDLRGKALISSPLMRWCICVNGLYPPRP
ncbi:MAG: hypothetical protein RLZZ516_2089 [Cyanobacteriota bacterium]|jgi:microcystin-dependent protein